MCTAIAWRHGEFYFGRTLDYEHSFGEEVVITPRNFPYHSGRGTYAVIGMARAEEGYPLYFDAANEKGLCMAGLNFPRSAVYAKEGGVPAYDLIGYLLSTCATVAEAREYLKTTCVTDAPFSPQLSAAKLHWLLADRRESATVESTEKGLLVYHNPVSVLTNEPEFPMQMQNLNNFMSTSAYEPQNRFLPGIPLEPDSRGMGGIGLPGDLSSRSRFVRAAFTAGNALRGEEGGVEQMFHILGSVEQVRGCCRLADGTCEITRYTSCIHDSVYYYTTYENRAITAVSLHRCDLDGAGLVRFPLAREGQIRWQN